MQFKKVVASFLVVLCLCSSCAVAYADAVSPYDDGIMLIYEIADSLISDLYISGNTAYCTSSADGSGAVSITVTQTLQKYWGLWIWNDVDNAEWTRTENRNSVYLSNSKSNLGTGTYRVKSVFNLIGINGKIETITLYSTEEKV